MNYSEFKKNLKKEGICGFGLYTDESVMSISISCNTITYLKELQQEEKGYDGTSNFNPYSEATIKTIFLLSKQNFQKTKELMPIIYQLSLVKYWDILNQKT